MTEPAQRLHAYLVHLVFEKPLTQEDFLAVVGQLGAGWPPCIVVNTEHDPLGFPPAPEPRGVMVFQLFAHDADAVTDMIHMATAGIPVSRLAITRVVTPIEEGQ